MPLVQRTGFSCLIEIVARLVFAGAALACATQAIFTTAAHDSNSQARKQRANRVGSGLSLGFFAYFAVLLCEVCGQGVLFLCESKDLTA